LFDAMNVSAADFPADMSELEIAGLHAEPSVHISVPRVAEAQVSMECKLHDARPLGENTLITGQVVMFHVADRLVGERFHIRDFAPVGRLGSPSVYCRTTDRFDIPRLSYAQWRLGAKDRG
jgi:flavin reductase (DIM6/NTAB) family NADH-FMN oxidoreductase RutF